MDRELLANIIGAVEHESRRVDGLSLVALPEPFRFRVRRLADGTAELMVVNVETGGVHPLAGPI